MTLVPGYAGLLYYLNRTVQYGSHLLENKKFGKLFAEVCPMSELFPWYGGLSHVCGLGFMGIHQYRQAVPCLENAGKTKFNYMVNIHLGLAYEQLGRWQEALNEYQYVLDYATSNETAKKGWQRCAIYLLLNRLNSLPDPPDPEVLKEEQSLASKIQDQGYRHANLTEAQMYILYLKNRPDQMEVKRNEPGTNAAASRWLTLARIRDALSGRDWDTVFELSGRMLDAGAGSPYVYMRLFSLLQAARPDTAENTVRYHLLNGRLYHLGGNNEMAREEIEQAGNLDPGNPVVIEWKEKTGVTGGADP